jgi:ribonucleoside-diphosphate reductase alpha chain
MVTDACLKVTRERLPNRRAHTLLNIEAGGFRYVAGVGHYGDGRLAEIFLNSEKGGTAIDDAARDSAVVASIALQHGVDADTLRHALMRNGSGVASGPLGTLLDLLAEAEG